MRPLPDGQWWSDINPAARILASNDGAAAWDSIAAAGDRPPFSVHLWVAGREGTVCAWEGPGGVNDMAARLPAAAVREFPGSGHSIHNSAPGAFVAALVAVVNAATGVAGR